MTNSTDRIEIITSVQRRRRWTASEKVQMVEETFETGTTVGLVARRQALRQARTFHRLKKIAAAAAVVAEGRCPNPNLGSFVASKP